MSSDSRHTVSPDRQGQLDPERDDAHERQRRGTQQLLLGRICFFVSAFAVASVAARKLGAADYGSYGVIISLLLWVETVATSTIPTTSKLIADGGYGAGEVEQSARVFLFGIGIVLLGVCWFLAPMLADVMRIHNGTVLFRLAALNLPLSAAYASYEGSLYGHRQFGVIALAHAGLAVMRLLGVAILIGLGFSVERMLLIVVSSTVLVVAALTARRRWPRRSAVTGIMRRIALMTGPVALYLIATQVLVNLDLWSLKSFWSGRSEVVGQYVAAVNVAKILTVVPSVQAGVLFASVAWAVASNDAERARQHTRESIRFALIITIAACVIIGSNGREVLSVLFSSTYADGYRFLWLQLAAFAVFAFLDVFCWSLMATGRHWVAAGALVTILPIAWISNYILIPRLGPVGAAISLMLATSTAAVATGVIATRHFGLLIPASSVARVSLAAMVVWLFSSLFQVDGPRVVMKLTLLGGLYLTVLYATGEITGRDFGRWVNVAGDRAS